MVGAEEDDNGDEDDDVVPEAVVASVAAAPAPFCVKSIVRRTGWQISSTVALPTTIADVAHNSRLLTLAGIVTLIGNIMGASFPRTRLTSMPMFLVVVVGGNDGGGAVVIEVSVLGGMAVVEVTPPTLSPIFNVNLSGLVPSGGVVVLVVVPVLSPPPPVNV